MEVGDTVKQLYGCRGWAKDDTAIVVKILATGEVLLERTLGSPETIEGIRCHVNHIGVVV